MAFLILVGSLCLCHIVPLGRSSGEISNDQRWDFPEDWAPDEARLVHHLLRRYSNMGKVARPRYNSSHPLKVQFGMRLIQMDVIEKEQILKTSVWVRARWFDEYLRWDPNDFGGLGEIVLPWDQVWIPDIVLVNTAETEVSVRHADIMVSSIGAVVWSPHRVYKSACLVDVTNYPYDEHTCHLWFQSMSRYSWQLNIEAYSRGALDLETYLASFEKSQEWEITKNATERFESSRDAGMMLKFSRRVALRFTLGVRRRLGYTGHLLMLPCVLLGCMSLVVFCLPPERPDRHTLAVSLLGSFLVLTLILVEIAPPTAASIPKLSKYYASNMTLVMLSVFLSGAVVNVSRRGERNQRVPRFIEIIAIDVLARILLLHGRVQAAFYRPRAKKDVTAIRNQYEFKPFTFGHADALHYQSENHSSMSQSTEYIVQIDEKLRKLETLIVQNGDRTCEEVEHDYRIARTQWRNVAIVMDRLFFVMYLITLIVTFVLLFPRPVTPPQT